MTGFRRWVGVVVCGAVLAACSLQTATAPTGKLTLYASFEDAQDLTAGHNVQISNVVAGSVRDVSLDGYQARVRMSIVDGHDIPKGTTAVVRRTSLLGEYYVDLVFPDGFEPEDSEYLASGDEITRTETQPDIEQLAEQASVVVGAVTADDLAVSVEAAAEGLGGRGATLNRAIRDAATVVSALADQQADLAAAVDGLGRLGEALGPSSGKLGEVIDALVAATEDVAGSRAGIVQAVDALVDLATVTNDVVLEPHTERLRTMLGQLNPLLGTLADRGDELALLITDLLRFTEAFPTALHNGNILLLAWAFVNNLPILDLGVVDDSDPLDALAQLVRGEL